MKPEEIANFRNLLSAFSLEQLQEKEKELNNDISRMIMDSDLVMKVAIVRSLIAEKKDSNGETK